MMYLYGIWIRLRVGTATRLKLIVSELLPLIDTYRYESGRRGAKAER